MLKIRHKGINCARNIASYDLINSYESSAKMLTGRIACTLAELGLGITLNGGQSFRWVTHKEGQNYRGIFGGHVWTLSQDETHIFYSVHSSSLNNVNYETLISKYFHLEVSLEENLKKWVASDPYFHKMCEKIKGVRILNQDVVENLFSFICSSNNNIIRISSMVEKLCRMFGKILCEVDDETYYDFPTIESLAKPEVESMLRKEGFGYRASYIVNTAKRLIDLGGRNWLLSLCKANNMSYAKAREHLITLPGVGPKVADCVCLMSLGHLEAIPVDTHIFQVARTNYMPHLKNQKTVTPKIHEEVSNHLRNLWGSLAGWAQAIVFCAKINSNNISLRDRKRLGPKNSLDSMDVKKKTRKRR